jgi:molybdenum cofactor cytidylyltransferase
MRASVCLALEHLAAGPAPTAILLAPADSPGLAPPLVARVIAAGRAEPDRLIVPTHEGRRGHPAWIPWTLAVTIPNLPPNLGVNALFSRHAQQVRALPIEDASPVADLDTPEDYERWRHR